LCVKKTIFCAKIGVPRNIFCLFYTRHKNVGFLWNLPRAHRMSRVRAKFVLDFLSFWKCFFRWWEHMLPCPESNFRFSSIYSFLFLPSKFFVRWGWWRKYTQFWLPQFGVFNWSGSHHIAFLSIATVNLASHNVFSWTSVTSESLELLHIFTQIVGHVPCLSYFTVLFKVCSIDICQSCWLQKYSGSRGALLFRFCLRCYNMNWYNQQTEFQILTCAFFRRETLTKIARQMKHLAVSRRVMGLKSRLVCTNFVGV
jgi:hypothetical protein